MKNLCRWRPSGRLFSFCYLPIYIGYKKYDTLYDTLSQWPGPMSIPWTQKVEQNYAAPNASSSFCCGVI